MAEYHLIEKQHQLDLAVALLRQTDTIAVDTESSGYFTYFNEICLLQLRGGGETYLIDVMQHLKLKGLADIFANPDIQKIFHAAASDISELKKQYEWKVCNIFDTFLACRMLGGGSCSLASLVDRHFQYKMNKKEQKSNWRKRPLSKSQLDYAARDTLYLAELREKLQHDLTELGLMPEYLAECDFMQSRDYGTERIFDTDAWIRINGAAEESPEVRGRIKALFELRDKRARKQNIATFRLVSNEGLLNLASLIDANEDSLIKTRAVHPRFIQKEKRRLLEALAKATAIEDQDMPVLNEPDAEVLKLLKRLKRWRSKISKHRGLETGLILSNRALARIAGELPQDTQTLATMDLMNAWKLEHYADGVLSIVQGEPVGPVPEGLPVMPEDRRAELPQTILTTPAKDG